MPWYFFALATPFLYTITNFIEKFLVEKKSAEPLLMTFLYGTISFFIGVTILFLKNFPLLEPLQIFILLISGAMLNLYLLPYFKALQLDDASRVVPLFQFSPVIVLISSFLFLNEPLLPKQIFGAVIIIGAGFILGSEKIEARIFSPRKSLLLMIISASMYAFVLVLFRSVVKVQEFWTVFAYEYIGMGIGVVFLVFHPDIKTNFKKNIVSLRPIIKFLILSSGFSILAQIFQNYAISLVPVAMVNLLLGVQPICLLGVGLILSFFFPKILKEDISWSTLRFKLCIVFFMIFGLYFVYS